MELESDSSPTLTPVQETLSDAVIVEVFRDLGYESPTPVQMDAVRAFVSNKDVFIIQPTGSGKSLCYICLPLIFKKLTDRQVRNPIVIVVSPLISLMKDQVLKYRRAGITCTFLGSEQTDETQNILQGCYNMVFASPESLLTVTSWRDMLSSDKYRKNVVGLVIDEAHCVQMWGLDFRTEYGNLSELRSILPKVNVMALTATVTKVTRDAIMRSLCMEKETVIIEKPPEKTNITYKLFQKPASVESILIPIVNEVVELGMSTPKKIIFCRSYVDLLEIYTHIVTELFNQNALHVEFDDELVAVCAMFSASTEEKVKNEIMKGFIASNGPIRIVVATIAFRMGLDAPNVRTVIHWGPAMSIEAYLQETGRASRDGLEASAVLYVKSSDYSKKIVISDSMKQYCSNIEFCRRTLLMREFIENYISICDPPHKCCDICGRQCSCAECHGLDLRDEDVLSMLADDEIETIQIPTTIVTEEQRTKLEQLLIKYRTELCMVDNQPVPLLFGPEITSGVTDESIRLICGKCELITSSEQLIDIGITSKVQREYILSNIFKKVFPGQ